MNASISTIRLLAALCAGLFFTAASAAENFPTKAIKLVLGYSAGGTADARAREFAPVAGTEFGQKVVVDNRPGASGTIAADSVAKSPPVNAAFVKACNSPEVMKRPGAEDLGNLAGTPEAVAAFMKAERGRWVKLVKASGIKLE
ncbi:MAG: tripartite tricarboxylate transporter substrate-binding protein [Burkholderiales bacterium]